MNSIRRYSRILVALAALLCLSTFSLVPSAQADTQLVNISRELGCLIDGGQGTAYFGRLRRGQFRVFSPAQIKRLIISRRQQALALRREISEMSATSASDIIRMKVIRKKSRALSLSIRILKRGPAICMSMLRVPDQLPPPQGTPSFPTETPTATLTPATPQQTAIPTNTALPSSTQSAANTPTGTPTSTATASPTTTRTATRTPTSTTTQTATPSRTPTLSVTATRTPTATATTTASPTATFTQTPTMTATATPSRTPTLSSTATRTPTATATRTASPTVTRTQTPTMTATTTPTGTPTSTITPTVTPTVTRTPTPSPTTSTSQSCQDGIDNDGDGATDWPADAKCASPTEQELGSAPSRSPLKIFGWSPGQAGLENIKPMYIHVYPPNTPETIANAASQLMARPPGERAIIFINRDVYDLIRRNPQHACRNPNTGQLMSIEYQCPWLEEGTAATRSLWQTFFAGLAARGATVDLLSVNYEMPTLDYWASEALGGPDRNPARYQAIQNDPRFTQEFTQYAIGDPRRRSVAAQLGFSNLSLVYNWAPEAGGPHYPAIWNSLMYDRIAAYMTDAIYAPARQYFPNIKVSDNPTMFQDASFNLPDANGSTVVTCDSPFYCSSGRVVGTHQSPSLGYDPVLGSGFENGSIKFDGVRSYTPTLFNSFRYAVNKFRIAALSEPNTPITPITACRSHAYGPNNSFYQEAAIHVALSGVDDFFLWNAYDPYWAGVVLDCPDVLNDNEILNRVVREFNTLAGFSGRTPLTNEEVNWYSDYALSGMMAGDRRVWRFSPREYDAGYGRPALSVQATLAQASPPTFMTRQKRITFPEGTLYSPLQSSSSLGFWITQPLSAPPPLITDDGVNSAPVIIVTIHQNPSNGWIYFEATESFDDDGVIRSWLWDLNNNGVIDWFETSMRTINFWTADIGPGSHTSRVIATDDLGLTRSLTFSYSVPSSPCAGQTIVEGTCELGRFSPQ